MSGTPEILGQRMQSVFCIRVTVSDTASTQGEMVPLAELVGLGALWTQGAVSPLGISISCLQFRMKEGTRAQANGWALNGTISFESTQTQKAAHFSSKLPLPAKSRGSSKEPNDVDGFSAKTPFSLQRAGHSRELAEKPGPCVQDPRVPDW
jgi:hypothetical protein